jgi:hypothetical protein
MVEVREADRPSSGASLIMRPDLLVVLHKGLAEGVAVVRRVRDLMRKARAAGARGEALSFMRLFPDSSQVSCFPVFGLIAFGVQCSCQGVEVHRAWRCTQDKVSV